MHTLHVEGLDRPLRVMRFAGYEEISKSFRIDVTVVSDDHDPALFRLVGRAAGLAIDGDGDGEPRWIHGIVSRSAHGGATVCQVTLVPATWRMGLGADSRIFQGMTVPEIVAGVLDRARVQRLDPLDPRPPPHRHACRYRMALAGSYRARDCCVQYHESDGAFVERLLEEEGIHTFFEHDETSCVLVITDATTEHEALSGGDTIPYRPPSGALFAAEHISRFSFSEESRPGRVAVQSYSFERPMLPLAAAAQAGIDDDLEILERSGNYDLPHHGDALARVRLEELQASRWTGDGDSDAIRLVPGRTFCLADHPAAELNRAYLVTRVEHRFDHDLHYTCRFEVIPAGVPFRPARRTPRPVIQGPQTAIVVGPPGEEIHTDPHGRVKVRFHWDRSGMNDDRCSAWIRVAQASAGAGWGSLFLPRVGHEVVVDFLDGDPERPLVTGSVYHAANVPPYALPAEKSKSTLKTSSYPGGGGSNELRFEDRKGAEEVYLHAQKDLAVEVVHDETVDVGNDQTTNVGANRMLNVTGLDTQTVLLAQAITVGMAQTVMVGGFMSIGIRLSKKEHVGASSTEQVVGMKSTRVGLSYSLQAGIDVRTVSGRNTAIRAVGNISEEAGRNVSITAMHNIAASAGGSVSVSAGDGMSVSVLGSHSDTATETRTIVAGERLVLQCGAGTITVSKDGNITVEGKNITVRGQGPVAVEGTKLHVKSAGPVVVHASGKVQVKGGSVDMN